MKKCYVLLFVLAAHSTAFASSVETWDDLQKIILTNSVTNIDDLLTHLPAEYTKGFTLIYRTRALNQERVSPRRPRVLLFGQDAKFVLAYNSHWTGGASQPGDNESIETLAYDDVTGQSYLREIPFNGLTVPDLSKVEVNPDRCLACHAQSSGEIGADPGHSVHALWEPYNSWAGVYGSLSRENIDFIKFDTTEYSNIQQFLQEKTSNPRYASLELQIGKLSDLQPNAFIGANFDPAKMNDALTFSDGYNSNPNQILGMYLADYNFHRVGNIIADLDPSKRAAFQYLIRGLTRDEESFVRADTAPWVNPTNHFAKDYTCQNMIASFLPDSMVKVSFDGFMAPFLAKMRADYFARKVESEVENMGLSKLGAGFDPKDPYDENRAGRGLVFDSINSGTFGFLTFNPKHSGYTEATALFYLLYLMDLPSQDYSTAIARGDNVAIDSQYVLSGNTQWTYGNASRCYTPDGKPKSMVLPYDIKQSCISGPADEFFTDYLPARYYQNNGLAFDPTLGSLSCEELAAKSKAALTEYFSMNAKSLARH